MRFRVSAIRTKASLFLEQPTRRGILTLPFVVVSRSEFTFRSLMLLV